MKLEKQLRIIKNDIDSLEAMGAPKAEIAALRKWADGVRDRAIKEG